MLWFCLWRYCKSKFYLVIINISEIDLNQLFRLTLKTLKKGDNSCNSSFSALFCFSFFMICFVYESLFICLANWKRRCVFCVHKAQGYFIISLCSGVLIAEGVQGKKCSLEHFVFVLLSLYAHVCESFGFTWPARGVLRRWQILSVSIFRPSKMDGLDFYIAKSFERVRWEKLRHHCKLHIQHLTWWEKRRIVVS